MVKEKRTVVFSLWMVTVGFLLFFPDIVRAQSCGGPPPAQCVLSAPSIGGLPGSTGCPSTVTVTSTFMKITSPTVGCTFTCAMNTLERVFTADSCRTGTANSPATQESNTLTATFNAKDKNYHYVGILTTVVQPNGGINTYNSPTVGTRCS